jgi:hypothetical protein
MPSDSVKTTFDFFSSMSPELIVSIIILFFTAISLIWRWWDRRKTKPFVQYLTYQTKNCFNVTIYNNAPYNLKIKKAYKRIFWFIKKPMSIGTTDVNNPAHSDMLAKKKLGNIFEAGGKQKTFRLYLRMNEKHMKKMYLFKTNAGTCKKRSK